MSEQKKDTKIPNHVFDMEYSTQRKKEYLFLKQCGIIPTFVRENRQYGVRTYKYEKTPELFEKVAEFYRQDAASNPKKAPMKAPDAEKAEAKNEEKKTMTMTEFMLGILGGKQKREAKIIM